MKKPDRRVIPIEQLNRRDFCFLAGCAAGALALAACTDDGQVVGTGPIGPDAGNGGGGGGDSDAGTVDHTPDAGTTSGATCSGSEVDVGAPSQFSQGTATLFSSPRFYVVRDANGLYAVSSRCTHEGVQNNVVSGQFYCPRHGARFTFNGAVISGPTNRALSHYSMCTLSNGHVAVNTAQTVSASTRLAV